MAAASVHTFVTSAMRGSRFDPARCWRETRGSGHERTLPPNRALVVPRVLLETGRGALCSGVLRARRRGGGKEVRS